MLRSAISNDKRRRSILIILTISLFCGVIFGFGWIVSGMNNPARVLNFLDWGHRWDATLALVMGGAIAVAIPGF
jgi:uncharacterized protein